MDNTTILKLTCAVAIAGSILRAGELIEVTRSEAADLVRRGKAVPHAEAPAEGQTVTPSGTVDPEPHPVIADYQADRNEQAAERVANDPRNEEQDDAEAPAEGAKKSGGKKGRR